MKHYNDLQLSNFFTYLQIIFFFCSCVLHKLQLGEAALKIEVNPSAVDLSSFPEAHVYGCLQEHIAKLQVKGVQVPINAD